MRRIVIIGACLALLAGAAGAGELNNEKALGGVKRARIVCDVNVGDPDLLLKRMQLLDTTRQQLAAAGRKPVIVIAVRGRASLFFTAGDAYVHTEEREAKRRMREWVERFHKLGIRIEQCAIAAQMQKVSLEDYPPQVAVVENGYISLIGYQHQGYALLPMD